MNKKQNISPKHVLITGASSGLGAALAHHYAANGVILSLQGRSSERLEKVAQECREKGAQAHTQLVDVQDAPAMEAWLQAAENIAPVDLVIANAGISAGTGGRQEGIQQVRDIFATNVDGVINTIHPISFRMVSRGHGQIAIISSLAGIRAMPSCPAYSASKAAARYYGEALRGAMKKTGVKVSVVCPGYIKTPMTDINPFPMPLMMSAEKAARIIACGLEKNAPRIAFPRALYFPLWCISCLSPRITNPFFERLPAKPSAF